MSRTQHEDTVAQLLHRLADYARTEPTVAPAPLVVERRLPPRTWTLGLAAAVLVAALASVSLVLREDRGGRLSITGRPSALAGGKTDQLAEAGLEGRSGAASAWTGKELLVWGGVTFNGSENRWLADGAALDPVANRWRPLPAAPLVARGDPAAVWTGSEMLVWGGSAAEERFVDGAAFNPQTNGWRTISSNPFGGVMRPAVVWTGTEMLVFSSTNGPRMASAYDPRTDRWRRLAPLPGLLVMPFPQVVWTGSTAMLVLWPDTSTQPPGSGFPTSGLAPAPGPAAGTSPTSPPGTPPPLPTRPMPAGGGPNSDMFLVSYSPETDQWSRLPEVELRDGGVPRLVWTGQEALLLQNGAPGAAFDPARQAWRSLSAVPEGRPFADAAVWTGRLALLWSGGDEGLAYDPQADIWLTFDAGGQETRSSAVVAWADGQFVGWGGFTTGRSVEYQNDGIRYRPSG